MLTSLLGFTFPSELQQRRASGVSSQERSAAATQRKSLLLPSAESQTDLLFDPARQPGRGQQRKSSFFDARHHNMLNTSAGAISVQLMGSGEASPTSPAAAAAASTAGTAQRRRMVVGLGFTSVDVLKWMAEDIAMPDLESSNSVVSTGKSSPITKSRGSSTLPAPANPRHATAPPTAPVVGADSQAAAIDDSITSLLPDMGEAAMDGSAPPNPHESVASLMPDLMTDDRALVDGSESGSPTKRRSESTAFPEFESQSQVGGSSTPKGALTMLVRYFARAQERTAAAAIKAEDRRRASQGGSRQSDPSSQSSSGVHAVPTGPIVNQSLKKFRAVAVAATIAFKFRAVKLEGSNKQRAKAMASRAIEARDAALRVAFDVAYGGGVRYDRSDLYRKRRVSGFNSSQAGKVLAMRDGSVTVPAQTQQQQQQQSQHHHKSVAVHRAASPDKPARHDSPDEGALRGSSPPDASSPHARTTTHPPVPASEGPFVLYGGPLADDAGSPSLELSLLSPAKNLGRLNSASMRSAATDRSALQIPPSESVAQHYLDACSTLQLPVNRSVLRILATYDEHQYRSKTAALRKTISDVSTDNATAAPLRHSFSFSGRSAPPASASQPSWSPSATGLETPADTHVASSPLSIHRGTPPVLSDEDLVCDFSATYCGCNGMVPIVVALERAWALRRLSFAGCGVNDAAVIQLCAVLEASCPKLQHLDLSTNPKIGFAGGSALHNLALSCRKLTSVVLRGTNIRGSTARSIERKLADRKKHPSGATQKSAASLPPMAPSLRRVVSNTRSTASSSLLRRLHVSTKFADDDGSSSSDDDGVVAALPVPTE